MIAFLLRRTKVSRLIMVVTLDVFKSDSSFYAFLA